LLQGWLRRSGDEGLTDCFYWKGQAVGNPLQRASAFISSCLCMEFVGDDEKLQEYIKGTPSEA
jgi:hypothetical protein